MHHEPTDEVLLPARKAAAIAGISRQRLYYWEQTSLISPSVRREISPRNIVRLYGFDRLVELTVAATLVRNRPISLQHIRSVLQRLRDRGHEHPLRELRFAVEGDQIFFQDEDGHWEGSRHPRQIVLRQVLDLEEIRARIRSAASRDSSDHGSVVRRRKVLGSKPVFAGTRVPVDAVAAFIRRGATDAEILEAYPVLERADVQRARRLTQAS